LINQASERVGAKRLRVVVGDGGGGFVLRRGIVAPHLEKEGHGRAVAALDHGKPRLESLHKKLELHP